MNDTETAEFASHMRSNYPGYLESDFELVLEIVSGLSLRQAKEVVKRVRMGEKNSNRPPIPAIRLAARAMPINARPAATMTRKKVITWLRELPENQFSVDDPDWKVITDHYAGCWRATLAGKKDPKLTDAEFHYGQQFGRNMIRVHCRDALIEVGIPEADALDYAEQTVGLAVGEKISLRPLIKSVEAP